MVMTSASTRADGSLALRFSTPELRPADKTAFFELLNTNLKVLVEPFEEPLTGPMHEVKSELDSKTPGQRLRNTLFVYWKQTGEPADFDTFYKRNMEKIILYVKSKLEPKLS